MNLQDHPLEVYGFEIRTEAFSRSRLSEDPVYLWEFRISNFELPYEGEMVLFLNVSYFRKWIDGLFKAL